MKKNILVTLLATTVVLLFSACSASAKPAESSEKSVSIGTWSVAIVVDGASHAVTSAAVAKLNVYTCSSSFTTMGGKETHTYTGARLKDVLASIGVTNVTSVNATGTDDYTPNMPETKDLAMDNNTLLAWGMDGKNLESIGPVMLTPCSSTVGSQFVKMVATITVTGATLAST